MEIVEAINLRDNVKEFIEEKFKKAVKEVTAYKKQLVQNSKITRFLNQHTIRARLAVIFKSVSTFKNTFKCFWDENKVFGKF